jgi:transposase InsO family protein
MAEKRRVYTDGFKQDAVRLVTEPGYGTTEAARNHGVAPNELARQFDVDQPNVAWVGDITYLWTQEGWLYLAVLLDLYSRKVVG